MSQAQAHGNHDERLMGANGSSETLYLQLESLHGTYLGRLHVSGSCVTWFVCGAPCCLIRTYPWHELGVWNQFSVLGCLTTHDAWREAWSCLRLMYHALWTPMGGLPLSQWRQEWMGMGRQMGGGGGNEKKESRRNCR